jgi:hypothetical protein
MNIGVVSVALSIASAFLAADLPQMEPNSVTVPGQGWAIAFKSPPLVQYAGSREDKNFEFRAAGEKGFNLSIYVEKPQGDGDSHEACFKHYWPLAKRNPMIDQASVKVTKGDNYVRVAYEIRAGNQQKKLQVRNVNYYFAYKDRWTDVHVSLFPPKETDEQLLEQFEQSLRYKPSETESSADAESDQAK